MRLRDVPFLCVLLVGSIARADDRPAAAILAELEKTPLPEMPGFKNRGEMKDFSALHEKAGDRRAELIGELYRAQPDAPELAKLLPEQWNARLGTPKFDALLKAEIEDMIARSKDEALVATASYWRVVGQIGRYPEPGAKTADLLRAVDGFTSRYPKDARGGALLQSIYLVRDNFDEQEAVFRRLETEYPNSKALYQTNFARTALLRQRRIEAMVGKPFPMEFTDAITGSKVSIDDLKGKVVVVNFRTRPTKNTGWGPALKKVHDDYKDKGVEFIDVTLDLYKDYGGGLEGLKAELRKEGIGWPQWYLGLEPTAEFTLLHDALVLPVIGRDGLVVSMDNLDGIKKRIDAALAKPKPAP